MDMSPERIDPVSGNEIPLGATAENVRDDIPAQLSEGEYVVPADVVNYYGVKFFEDLRSDAKEGYQEMAATGRIGGEPIDDQDSFPFSLEELAVEGESEYNTGGVVQANEGIYAQRAGISLPPRSSVSAPASVASVAPVAPAGVTTSVQAEADRRAGRSTRSTREQSPYLDPLTGLLRPEAPSRDYRSRVANAYTTGSLDAAERAASQVAVEDLPGLTRFREGNQPVFLKSGAVVPTSRYANLYQTDLFYNPDTMESLRRTMYKPTGQYIGEIPQGYVPYTNTIGLLGNVFPQDGSAPNMSFMEYQRRLRDAQMRRQTEGAIFDPRNPDKKIDRSFMKDDLSLFDQVNWESMTDADELRNAILNVRLGVGSEGSGTRVGQFGGRFASGETNRAVGQVERLLQASIAAGDKDAQLKYGQLLFDIRQELQNQGLDKNNDGLEDTAVQKSTPGFGEDPLSIARGQNAPTQAEFMGIKVPEIDSNAEIPGLGFEMPSDATIQRQAAASAQQDRFAQQAEAMRANQQRMREAREQNALAQQQRFAQQAEAMQASDARQRDMDTASRQLRDLGLGVPKRLPDTPDIRVEPMADPVGPEAFMQRRMRGFNEGGQVRGYQYGGMPQLVPLEEEIDVSNLPNIDRPTVVSDGSSVAEAAERRANLGDFFRNLPGRVSSAASDAAAYVADPSNYIPSAEERAANRAANQAAADERRAVNQKLADGFGEMTSNVADLASTAASITGARMAGLAQVPGTMASNAATMYHRMEGGAERDAYDAGYQAGYKAGLSASGKMSSQPGGRGAAPVESGTYGRGTVAGPTAEQIQYSPLSSYTLRSANAARLSDTSANLTGAAATRGAAPVVTGTYGRGTVAGPTAAQLRSARDPMPSQPASPVNNDPIPSQPGVAPFMDPIPSQPGVAPKRYADPIPGAPDLVPTPQSYLSGLSAPLEDFPMETFSMKRPSPADAPMTQTQQERQSVQDRIAELRAQLGQTDTNTEAAVPNTAASEPNALDRANMRLDLLLGGN